jgi:anti-sigma B factor antagonist
VDVRTAGMTAEINRHDDGVAEVRVAGDLDLSECSILAGYLTALAEHDPPWIAVDLAEVSYFGCSALNALLTGLGAAIGRGGFLYLTAASRTVSRVLDLTGTTKILTDRDAVLLAWPEATVF